MDEAQSLLPVVLVNGPSGAGKSTVAAWLAEDANLVHVEIDRYPEGDGIDLEGLREPWDEFWLATDAAPLAALLRERSAAQEADGLVASFPSGVVPNPLQLASLERESVLLVTLYGSGADCLEAFLRREHRTGRGLDVGHWTRHNAEPYAQLSEPRFASYRLDAFRNGRFRDRKDLVMAIRRRMQLA